MVTTKRAGPKGLKWNLTEISLEFEIKISWLQSRFKMANEMPDSQGFYTSLQVKHALQGNSLGEIREKKMTAETELAIAKRMLIDKEYLKKGPLEMALSQEYSMLRRIIERAKMDEPSRIALLKQLGKSPEALMEEVPADDGRVVRRQGVKTRKPRSTVRNGAHARN